MLLNPGLIAHAALLRAMPGLLEVPAADLSKAEVLAMTGVADVTYAPFAPSALVRRAAQAWRRGR